jgi:hypothetical protein
MREGDNLLWLPLTPGQAARLADGEPLFIEAAQKLQSGAPAPRTGRNVVALCLLGADGSPASTRRRGPRALHLVSLSLLALVTGSLLNDAIAGGNLPPGGAWTQAVVALLALAAGLGSSGRVGPSPRPKVWDAAGHGDDQTEP